jgi:O-antigen/teichoic acid export membrane protein
MFRNLKHRIDNLLQDNRFSEILTGSFYSLFAKVIATLLSMITSIIIVRLYGADMMGVVAVLNSFLMLSTIFTLLGTNTAILRLIPEQLVTFSAKSALQVYRKTQYMVITTSLVTGILLFFGSDIIAEKLFSKANLSFYIKLASMFVLFKSMMLLNTQAVRGVRLIKIFAVMQVLPTFFNLVLLLLLTALYDYKDNPVYSQLSSILITAVAGWVIMEICFHKKIKIQDVIDHVPLKRIIRVSLPMMFAAGMSFLMGQIGVIMLGIFRSEQEVGYYAIAVRLASLPSFFLVAINSMSASKFSELYAENRIDDLFHVAKKSAKLIFWTTAPVVLCLLLFGKPLLWILYGRDFGVAFPAMLFLVAGQFVNCISGSTAMFMNMTTHQNEFRNIMIMAALINFCLNFFLIPSYGIIGAGAAVMTSTFFWNVTTLIYIQRIYGKSVGFFPISS